MTLPTQLIKAGLMPIAPYQNDASLSNTRIMPMYIYVGIYTQVDTGSYW